MCHARDEWRKAIPHFPAVVRESGRRGQPSRFEATAPMLKRLTAEAA